MVEIEERLVTMLGQWGRKAQTNIPTPPLPGIGYRNTELDISGIENGQLYDRVFDSARYNQLLYTLTGLVMELEKYGFLPWSPLTNYPEGGLVLGADSNVYQAQQPTGPQTDAGPQKPDDSSQYWQNFSQTALHGGGGAFAGYMFEPRGFLRKSAPEGWLAAEGGIVGGVADKYPEAVEALQSDDFSWLVKTEEEWWAIKNDNAVWKDVAGACPYYVLDLVADTLRVPDLRGLYFECAGFDALEVCEVHGDAIREITGTFSVGAQPHYVVSASGALKISAGWGVRAGASPVYDSAVFNFNASNVIPTASVNRPRALALLPCVCLKGEI